MDEHMYDSIAYALGVEYKDVDIRLLRLAKVLDIKVEFVYPHLIGFAQGVYIPKDDVIKINRGLSFGDKNRALAHEIIHATGHSSRLGRDFIKYCESVELQGGFIEDLDLPDDVKLALTNRSKNEEVIADSGACKLLELFGLMNLTLRVESEVYIRKFGGETDLTKEHCANAIDYIMGKMHVSYEVA